MYVLSTFLVPSVQTFSFAGAAGPFRELNLFVELSLSSSLRVLYPPYVCVLPSFICSPLLLYHSSRIISAIYGRLKHVLFFFQA